MKAVGKYIVIQPLKEINVKTEGGLILSDKQREDIRYRQATVINTGTAVDHINKGDNIYYDKSAGFGIEINNKHYTVIKEFDVVVIL
jgi:co-chaperonin GroES (HSP10)|tara:strand:- start:179 stop:439 length:261 start_codon:yes stop_codon:yes gene_type:complete